MSPTSLEAYPRRILVVVTGMTPQVVTETVYALAATGSPVFAPTEVRLVTTQRGAELATSALLDADHGRFHRLRSDYDLPPIEFDAEHIHVLTDAAGDVLDDIRTPAHNTAAGDAITQLLFDVTRDESSALHVSIAGGRKTMGFYAGYALSLYGRRQDRLSHVLVSEPYESLREFYYPTPTSVPIEIKKDGRVVDVIDAQDGEVALADIPFVRLGVDQHQDLAEGKMRFRDAVDAAQRTKGPAELVIDLYARHGRGRRGRVRAGDRIVHLPPVQLAFLAWLARRQKAGLGWLPYPVPHTLKGRKNESNMDQQKIKQLRDEERIEVEQDGAYRDYAVPFLNEYRAIYGEDYDQEGTTAKGLKARGMSETFFAETKSKLHRELKCQVGKQAATPYLVSERKEQRMVYGLDIPAAAIHFGEIDP